MKKLIIGSDQSGFLLKEVVKHHLEEQGYEVSDEGMTDANVPLPYYAVAEHVGARMSGKVFERGILICGTGMGMAIVANKFPGVYAAVCENTYASKKARVINDANVLTMGGWITGEVAGCEIADVFLKTKFTENLEDQRAENLRTAREQVKKIEDARCKWQGGERA